MIVHKNVLNLFLVNNCRLGRVDINPPSLIFNNNNMALQVWLPLNKSGADKNQGLANINIVNNASYEVSGKLGGCYKNGTINSGWGKNYNACLGLSASCWINIPTIEGNAIILGSVHNYPANTRFYVGCYNGYFSGGFGNTSWGDAASNRKIESNTWYHLCMTTFGTNWKLYINGQCVQEKTSSANPVILYGNIYIGKKQALYNDFRIYDHCLSPKEVKEISKGLVLHYPLNDIYNGSYNLLNDSDTFTNWGDYEAGYTEIKINEFGRKSLIITNKRSWCGAIHSVQIPSAGTYTISCYCKPISRTKTSIKQTLYISGNGWNDQAVEVDWNKTNQWQRLSLTRTYNQAGSFFVYLIAFGGSRTDDYKVTCEYTMPQVTKTDTIVPYVEKSIPDSIVYDCSGYQNNGTISGSLSCSADSPRYKTSIISIDESSFSKILCSNLNLPNGQTTLSFWSKPTNKNEEDSSKIEITYSKNKYFTYINYPYFIHDGDYKYKWKNYWSDGNWHFVTCLFDGTNTKIYIDGNDISSSTGSDTSTAKTQLNNLTLLIRGNSLSDFRIYATALSEEDIKELYNTSCIINS